MKTLAQEKVEYLYQWLHSTRSYLGQLMKEDDASPEEIERVMKLESTIARQIRQIDQKTPPVQAEKKVVAAAAHSHAPKGA